MYGDTRTAKQRVGKKSKVMGLAKAMTLALRNKSSKSEGTELKAGERSIRQVTKD